MSITKSITIYTDGSCSGNPGPGGWAAILEAENSTGKHQLELHGGADATTNNQMELQAVLSALETLNDKRRASLRPGCEKYRIEATIVTDSQYVCTGIDSCYGWKARGWKTASGTPAKNQDMWSRFMALVNEGNNIVVTTKRVKGHAGHPENERCDRLAKDETALWVAKKEGTVVAQTEPSVVAQTEPVSEAKAAPIVVAKTEPVAI